MHLDVVEKPCEVGADTWPKTLPAWLAVADVRRSAPLDGSFPVVQDLGITVVLPPTVRQAPFTTPPAINGSTREPLTVLLVTSC